jgi:hypothetical protein
MKNGPISKAPGCAIVARDLGYDCSYDGYRNGGFALNEEREFFDRLDDERYRYYSYPADMNYDTAALYADGWISVQHPYALDATVLGLADSAPDEHRGYADDLAARAEAVALVNRASYGVELALFLAYMGRPLSEVDRQLERVTASDLEETAHAAAIREGFLHFAGPRESQDEREGEIRSHMDRRQALHAGAGAAAMLAGDPQPERWLADGQPFMSGIIRHHMALVRSPEQTSIDIEGRYSFAWPHHDLFESAARGTRDLGDALAKTRVVNPAVIRELVARRKGDDPALADWVEHHFPAPCWDCGLTALAANVGARLLDARSVGDERFAHALELIANRIVEGVMKRGVAAELFVLEREPARK